MMDGLYAALETPPAVQQKPQKLLRMVKNDRMGGSVPKWETQSTSSNGADSIEASLTKASKAQTDIPDSVMAYNAPIDPPAQSASAEFGFSDLVDMVNPLHHIPVVGHLYRGLTGDDIKPIGQIMGGALYGGPVGAASGLINTVITHETGKDMTSNAMAFVTDGQAPTLLNASKPLSEDPETRLANVSHAAKTGTPNPLQDLPVSLLAFTAPQSLSDIKIERTNAADGRTAGSFKKTTYEDVLQYEGHVREPITQVRFSRDN